MQKLLRLFSPIPVFRSNQKHRLFVPITSSTYPLGFFICSRVCVFIVLIFSYQPQYLDFWCLALTACLLLLGLDIKNLIFGTKLVLLGYEQAFFVVDSRNIRIDALPSALIYATPWLVAIKLRAVAGKQTHFLMLGRWNLSSSDFHSLRSLAMSL